MPPSRRSAADICLTVIFQGAFILQVGDKHGMILQIIVFLKAQPGKLLYQLSGVPGDEVLTGMDIVGQTRCEQLLKIVDEMLV